MNSQFLCPHVDIQQNQWILLNANMAIDVHIPYAGTSSVVSPDIELAAAEAMKMLALRFRLLLIFYRCLLGQTNAQQQLQQTCDLDKERPSPVDILLVEELSFCRLV